MTTWQGISMKTAKKLRKSIVKRRRGAQAHGQLPAQGAAPLDVQRLVNGFIRDPHGLVTVPKWEDLPKGPCQAQFQEARLHVPCACGRTTSTVATSPIFLVFRPI